jgi:hypothetical protein
MKAIDILKTRNEKGIISFSNEVSNWYAISRDGYHVIEFYDTDKTKFYKTEKSWAKRIVTLMNRGL